MNRQLVDKLARALLYEGYILYPYRPSVKNHQRWTFGGLYPPAWSDAQSGTDAWSMQTEVLVNAKDDVTLQAEVRFLHLTDRTVGKFPTPLPEFSPDAELAFERVEFLEVGEQRYQPWQEAVERTLELGEFNLAKLLTEPRVRTFAFDSQRAIEPLPLPDGQIAGILVRHQQAIEGKVEFSAVGVGEDLLRVTVKVVNTTPFTLESQGRDDALMRSLVSTHTILGLRNGEFVSLTDPPEHWAPQVAACKNIGCWPVLVGQEPQRDTILSSPIILGDYPQVAPESPGDLFDATEIDEILTLRIMTLTEEEKRTAAALDDRVRDLMARTESLAREQMMSLHGTVRGLQPVISEQHHHG